MYTSEHGSRASWRLPHAWITVTGGIHAGYDTRWRECELDAIELETPATGERPDRISASIIAPDGESAQLRGVADSFMTLSRPGQDNSRIHTSIGFASYRVGHLTGAGMFEYSRIASIAGASTDDDASDSD